HKPWTVIFSRAVHVFHRPYPGEAQDVLRFDVTPESASHMETMAIEFPVVLREDAVMRIHWGTTALPIRIQAPYKPDGEASIARHRRRSLVIFQSWSGTAFVGCMLGTRFGSAGAPSDAGPIELF